MTLLGIDVSVYNTTTNRWADFVFARCTSGTSKDQRYDFHRANTRKMGKPFGAYHFGYGSSVASPWAQADAFLAAAGDADLLALDLEGSNAPMSLAEARSFIAAIQAKGRKVGLYHSLSGYPPDALGADFRWVAYYNPTPPPIAWDIWQKRGMPLDLDRFDGSVDELLALGAPDSTGDPMAGFPISIPGGARAGTISFPTGIELFRLVDGATSKAKAAATGVAATSAIHDVSGGSAGFTFTTDATYWARADDVGFTPTAGDCTAQVTAAVAKEHEANRDAALKAVGEAIP